MKTNASNAAAKVALAGAKSKLKDAGKAVKDAASDAATAVSIKAGQVKDLYADVEKGLFRQTLQEKFFEEFDSNFLEDFPGFFEKLNELLLPERRLTVAPGTSLTPELRIAAFMRLGVNDSAKLAQVLNLSLNTIYTYRNRLRGRAADRENFERNIMKII